MRNIVVCADDYGISPMVSEAIIHLIKHNVITATSCMAIMPEWPEQASELKYYQDTCDIGLHFTLTNVGSINGLRFPNFSQLAKLCFINKLDHSYIRYQLNYQLDLFEKHIGKAPDYIDGHQYIQQLPHVKDILITTVNSRYPENKIYVRNTFDKIRHLPGSSFSKLKTLMLSTMGWSFKQSLAKNRIATNSGFRGLYNFKNNKSYSEHFKKFIRKIQPNSILVTHPGKVDNILLQRDPLTYQRELEYDFLSSIQFTDFMHSNQLIPSRFNFNYPASSSA